MIGTTLSHYRIVEKIGEGGMGEVYRAHDERLDRDVAIKVLPSSVAQDRDRIGRFEREARAVAKLSHPNILEIFEFSGDGDVAYAVTELLEGETLREHLKGGPLGWRWAAEIGAAIADGLAAAHVAGIVHRDVKPSNVFLTSDGRVKVLDFGLARTLESGEIDASQSPTVSRYTDPGTILGTVAYMSPEQVRGEAVDHRADIFALGCVLHEMVSGRRAFSRDTAVEIMNAILNEEPPDLRVLTGDLTPPVADIVRRCLEKRPEARFQTGQDLAFALRSILQGDSGPIARAGSEEKSIVVLPFDNLSPDPDQEYFSDGLTEEVISDLAKVRSLRVISRTSAMQLKGTDKDLRTIGRELNVRYVLEGSVRRAGNALRITAQLIDVPTDTHLWAEKYKGTLEDVFDIQEHVSRAIVHALKLKLSPEEEEKIAERPVDNVQALECYQRARQEIWRCTEDSLARAVQLIENGLGIVGENEMLYSAMGTAYLQYINVAVRPEDIYLQKAEECANRVFGLNPDSSRGHFLNGFLRFKRGDVQEAVRDMKHALEIDPNDADALMSLAYFYGFSGKAFAAEPLLRRLLDLDPLTPINHFVSGWVHFLDGRFETGLACFRDTHQMDPETPFFRFGYALALAYSGRQEEARSLLDRWAKSEPQNFFDSAAVFLRYALRGESSSALQAVTPELERAARWDEQYSWWMAACYSLIGRAEEALGWLQTAVQKGWICYPFLSEYDPFLENIRGEERFKKLIELVKREWETFEV